MIIDEPKHYQKHATTRNPYIVLFGFVTVAGLTHTNGFKKDVFSLNPSNSKSFEYNERGGLMILRTGINSSIGLYLLNFGSGYSAIKETPGAGSYFTIAADNGKITITNIYTGPVGMSIMIVNLD